MKKLNEVLSAISSLSDVSKILRLIVNTAIRVTDSQRSVIMILDKKKQKIRQAAVAAPSREFSYPVKEPKSDDITWRVIKEKKPISIKVKVTDSSVPKSRQVEKGTRTVLGLPLIGQEKVLGSLIISTVSPDAFGKEEVQILSILANQAAIAIEKSELIASLKEAQIKLQNWGRELEEKVKEKTEELKRSQTYLFQSEKLAGIGQLAAGVAHEMRNPLTVMKNSLYSLGAVLSHKEKAKRHLDLIDTQLDEASYIVKELLDFTREIKPELSFINVNDVVEASLRSRQIPGRVKVLRNLSQNLPQIKVDETQIRQAVQNLISNAIQAMPEGGKLSIRTYLDQKYVTISISDTGEGISKENLDKIFQPLFTTKQKGIGLGLTVTKRLVEANAGRIEVNSKKGEGSTFFLRFPAVSKDR